MSDLSNGSYRYVRPTSRWVQVGFVFLFVLVMISACGPERRKSNSNSAESETISIAQSFAQDGDLDAARSRLAEMDVANGMQWLVMQTEGAIDSKPDTEDTRALVGLALNLGSQSPVLVGYAERVGLVEASSADNSTMTDPGSSNTAVEPVQAVAHTPAPTVQVILMEPTEDAALPSATPETVELPTATSIHVPRVVASLPMNVRGGPGTNYAIVQAMESGQEADILGKNDGSDWWQVQLPDDQLGWVYGQLVSTSGDLAGVAVAASIPEPPPTSIPAPVVEAPTEPAEPEAKPVPAGNDFRVVERRLWDVYENGGRLDGPSVICGEKRQLKVNVLDANGGRLNGVAVQVEFGAKEIFVTGSQGKGDGVVEFILGEGQDVRVIRDVDGREVTSDVARGMVTKPAGISYEDLIGGQYCTNDADCRTFVDAPGCYGHYSWTVTFQRNY